MDGNGIVNCGICAGLAVAVRGKDKNGRWIEVQGMVPGVPLIYICVHCGKPWEKCGPPCEPLLCYGIQHPPGDHPLTATRVNKAAGSSHQRAHRRIWH